LGLLALASLLIAADAPEGPKPRPRKGLWAAISVNHPVRIPKEPGELADDFMLMFGLVNDGDKAVDPQILSSRLLVNGEPLEDWPGMFGGGLWPIGQALQPGKSFLFGEVMEKRFQEPGIYKLVWKGKGFESPEIVFRVMPKQK
jgi:hypothetical protein